MSSEKHTPLHANHLALGAKMVPFAGFSMPVHYSGIRAEHEAVRTRVGLFDVSHMGNIFIHGRDAKAFLQKVTVNNLDKVNRAGDPYLGVQYSALCYSDGTVVDDILVYVLNEESFKLVVNASNISKVLQWLDEHRFGDVKITDASEQLAILSLQGPRAGELAQRLTDTDLKPIPFYRAARASIAGADMLFSRTGYTGEDGLEFFPESKHAPALWEALLDAGSSYGILPIGLGARDTLRLEAGFSLYGHELTDKTNLLEAGLSWITDLSKPDFIGKNTLQETMEKGLSRKIVGLEMLEQGIPREGYQVVCQDREVGYVTSGTSSPTLNKGIALAYVDTICNQPGAEVYVIIRDVPKKARVVSRVFYKRPRL